MVALLTSECEARRIAADVTTSTLTRVEGLLKKVLEGNAARI